MAEALQRDFMDEFKSVYNEKGKHDLKAQIPYLSQLADRYKKLGEKDPKERWSDILKAHTLYNSCAVRSDGQDKWRWMQASYDIQKLYWGQEVTASKKDVESVATNIKVKLEALRTELRYKLEPIGEEIKTWQYSFESLESSPDAPEIPLHMCETIQHLSAHCNESMIDIVQSIIDEAVGICGEPPCGFSAIAFGSLAKGEATPYSDLEYLFLIEDESPDNISYFEKLAVNSYFILGNVQETNLKYMSIDELRQDKWFVDGAMSGLKIDGLSENAGNIPTGNNRPCTKKNRLILTPSELAKEYKDLLDNPASDQKQPGDLTDMLTFTREFYNHNNNDLLVKFRKTIAQYSPNEKRQTASKHMLQQDIKEYDFVPHENHTLATSCVNLKTDIYRYPSILIYDLKILHAIESSNTWDTLRALLDRMVISQQLYDSLLFLLCAAQYIRLSAYLDRNSQEDNVSILPKTSDTDTSVIDKLSWHLPQPLFFHICLTMLPVKSHITMNLKKEEGLTKPVTFNRYEATTKIFRVMQDYEAVIQCIRKRFPHLNNLDIQAKFDLAYASMWLSDCSHSLKLFTEILESLRNNSTASDIQEFVNTSGYETLDRGICCISLLKSVLLKRQGEMQQSFDVLGSIKDIIIDSDVSTWYYIELSSTYAMDKQFNLAEKYLKLAEDHISTSNNHMDMKMYILQMEMYDVARSSGKTDKAKESLLKALMLSEQIYGPGYHVEKGIFYHLLGSIALQERKSLTEAERYLNFARKNTEGSPAGYRVHLTYAELMMAQGDYKSALRSFRKLLVDKDASNILSDENYATINLGIGKCYMYTGAWPAAEFYMHRSRHFFIGSSTEIANAEGKKCETDFYIANCLFLKGQAKEALIALGQILEELCRLFIQTSGLSDFLSAILSLESIIIMLIENGELVGLHVLSANWCLRGLKRMQARLKLRKSDT